MCFGVGFGGGGAFGGGLHVIKSSYFGFAWWHLNKSNGHS